MSADHQHLKTEWADFIQASCFLWRGILGCFPRNILWGRIHYIQVSTYPQRSVQYSITQFYCSHVSLEWPVTVNSIIHHHDAVCITSAVLFSLSMSTIPGLRRSNVLSVVISLSQHKIILADSSTVLVCTYIYIYIHTHIYIYIYIYSTAEYFYRLLLLLLHNICVE